MRRPAQTCQVPGCNADLTNLRSYFVRQHICEEHARADSVPDGRGGQMRFCQQCTKLEPVSAFEGLKRSCEASLQKRHLRRSGGGAAAAARSRGSASSLAMGMGGNLAAGTAAHAAAAAAAAHAARLPMPLPPMGPSSGPAGAAAAAAIAAALAGRPEDRSSPCSTTSLQQANTTRSSSALRAVAGAGGAAAYGVGVGAPGGPLAVLMEAAGLPEAAADNDAAALVSIADLPPLASNTKEGSGATLPLPQPQDPGMANLPLHLLSQLPGFAPAQGQAALPGMQPALPANQLGAPGNPWQVPASAPWAQPPNSLAQLQAVLAGAATGAAPSPPTGGSGSAVDTGLPANVPSGGSSKSTLGSAQQAGAHEGLPPMPAPLPPPPPPMPMQQQPQQQAQQMPPMDMQQMLSALQLLQQLQDVISTMVMAQVQQQQQQQQVAAAPPPPPYSQPKAQQALPPHQQLLALLSGAAATGAHPQAVPAMPMPPPPPPMPAAQPQPLAQQGVAGGGDGPQAQLLQFLSNLAQQPVQQPPSSAPVPLQPQPQAPAPAGAPAVQCGNMGPSPAPQTGGSDAELLQAAAAAVGTGGGEDEQQLKALLQRLAGSLQQQQQQG